MKPQEALFERLVPNQCGSGTIVAIVPLPQCEIRTERQNLDGLDFDLIVLDVMMPGEDGISLTKSLRESRDQRSNLFFFALFH